MNKFWLVALMSVCGLNAFAQRAEILSDRTDACGFRTMRAKPMDGRCGSDDRHPMLFSLTHYCDADFGAWSLEVEFPDESSFRLPQGKKMSIELGNGKVVELMQSLPSSETEDVVGQPDETGKKRLFVMRGSYSITEEQLQSIADFGVRRIHVERANGAFDVAYDNNKAGKAIALQYALLKNGRSGHAPAR